MSGELPRLRMAPAETAEELGTRFERERRAVAVQREADLAEGFGGLRVGCVPYLNAAPLIRGIENQLVYATPSRLGEMLRAGELEAALVSVTEVLFHEGYDILDSMGICSLGEVQSVLLAHRIPLEEIREVHCDPASLTSVNLLRVLLAERGVHPAFVPLESYEFDRLPDAALIIGDRAIDLLFAPHDRMIWDLGAAWFELTRLPFVYAVWALRRAVDTTPLRRQLREARDFGMDTLDSIIASRPEYSYEFRKDYLGWHIHYHLGSDEKRGLARFVELLEKHGTTPLIRPRFVV